MVDTTYDALFKIIMVGDQQTGKTCMLQQYANGTFIDAYISTIGVDFVVKGL